jgi:predicted Zn-dependent protease
MILTEKEVKKILEKIISFSKADSVTVNLAGADRYNIRIARNSQTTSGFEDSLTVSVTSNFGNRSGTFSSGYGNIDSLKEIVRRSEEIAKLSPENREFIAPPGKQIYQPAKNFSLNTEKLTNNQRTELLSYIIERSVETGVITAGYYEDGLSFDSVINSNGLFAYNLSSRAEFSATSRTKDQTGSSRVRSVNVDYNKLNYRYYTDKLINRALLSSVPKELKPGKYTVILEPFATADMVSRLLSFMNSRQADEGRSYFSSPTGGNKIGIKILDEEVTIYSDPSDDIAPSIPFTDDGYPRNKVIWFENGILRNLHRNPYWAAKTSQEIIPYPSNLIMSGTDKTIDQIISETDYAILVTRLWYIRTVESKTMLLTGLTRDGLFEVRDGKISGPVKNFRFNESPVNVFSNIIEIGKTEITAGSETGSFSIAAPPVKVKDFNFTSLSDAI